MLLDHCYAFDWLLELRVKKFFDDGGPCDYFGPALDPPRANLADIQHL